MKNYETNITVRVQKTHSGKVKCTVRQNNSDFCFFLFNSYNEALAWIRKMYKDLKYSRAYGMNVVFRTLFGEKKVVFCFNRHVTKEGNMKIDTNPKDGGYFSVFSKNGKVLYTKDFPNQTAALAFAHKVKQNYTPKNIENSWRLVRTHKNGGGLVEITADVDPGAFIDSRSKVLDCAHVGNSKLYGSMACDTAHIGDGVRLMCTKVKNDAFIADGPNLKCCEVGRDAKIIGSVSREHGVLLGCTISEYDFGDGPVPAKRHKNGHGWVANTASVHETAFIGHEVKISDTVTIQKGAIIDGDCSIKGSATVANDVRIEGPFRIKGTATITDVNDNVFSFKDGSLVVIANNDLKLSSQEEINFGCGPVPAHRHINGGGWIAGTATVHETALVTYEASVSGSAIVNEGAKLYNGAQIKDCAVIGRGVVIGPNVTIQGKAIISETTFDTDTLQTFFSSNDQLTMDCRDGRVYVSEQDYTLVDFGKGAVPAHRHPNGGGWVANTATVHPTAFVYSKAVVIENAVVCKAARIDGSFTICGDAHIEEGVTVAGPGITINKRIRKTSYNFGGVMIPARQYPNGGGWVANSAKLGPNARVGKLALVGPNATVMGRVHGTSRVNAGAIVEEEVVLKGNVEVGMGVKVYGSGQITGNIKVGKLV